MYRTIRTDQWNRIRPMSNKLHQPEPTTQQNLLPQPRVELESFAQVFDGQPFWVYKDPLSLRYYRFNREEHFIIEQLRRGVTLEQLKMAHQDEFDSGDLSNQEVGRFISSLTERNLLIMNQPDRDELLYQAAKKRRRTKLFGQFTNILFIKIPLYDPDKLFNRLIDRLRFFWSRSFFLFYLFLLATAVVLVIRRWHDFVSMGNTDFFTIYNMPILFLALWLVKALHEFGHGLTCKNYGGEVHELGLLILVFMPMLYCNISDSWTFPSKAHRLLTTAGGVLAELFIAALATVVWYYTEQPGFIHAFAFNVIIVCSISTVFFNVMPLMRFDGYYFLMDLIEVPNLRQKANTFMKDFFIRYILGGHSDEAPQEHRFQFVFPLFAVASFIYRWFIMVVILFSIYAMLKQLHLVWLGRFFVLFTIVMSFLVPMVKTSVSLTKQRYALGISNIRLLILLAVLVTALAGVLFWPHHQHVTLNFVLEPSRIQWLRSEADGIVHWDEQTSEGAWVDVQSPLVASLENTELPCEAAWLTAWIEQARIDIAQWQNRDETQVEQLRRRLETFQNDETRLKEQIAGLKVKVPFTGEILTLDRDIRRMRGQYVTRATPLLLLADTRRLTAKVWVPENTYARIFKHEGQTGQRAELMLYAFSRDKFEGSVGAVSLHREDNMGEFGEKLALSNKVGGEVLTEYDPVAGQEKPVEAVYEVTIDLDPDNLPASARSFRPYMSGRTRIDCGQYTLYQWGRDSLLRFISPEVRL